MSTDTVWSIAKSPYLVTADLSVTNGAHLHIEPGVVVYMSSGTNFTVNSGALQAIGNAQADIVFTSAADREGGGMPGDWGQMAFLGDTLDAETVLDGVTVRHGKGVRVESASPTLNRLKLINNAGAAVSIDLKSSPSGVGLQAEGNDINGIVVSAGEIINSVQWQLRGIPYVLASGELSIGKQPSIAGVSPDTIQQGQTLDAIISGNRLAGAERIVFDQPGLAASIASGGTDASIPVRIVASASQPFASVGFEVLTAAGSARYDAGLSVIPVKPAIEISGIAPISLRREESKSFVLSGRNLFGASVSVPAGIGLTLGSLLTTPTQASFTLSASAGAVLGVQMLTVSNPSFTNGSATASVTVVSAFPKIVPNPSSLVVSPDGRERTFSLRLTDVDDVAHTLNLSVYDASIASLSRSSITIPAGETQTTVNMTGLKLGYTILNITSPTLATVAVPVYVTNALGNGASVGPLLSGAVGVARELNAVILPPGSTVGPTLSLPVGVDRAADASTLPTSFVLGPVQSGQVGVDRATDLSTLPKDFSVGPVLAVPVGVERILVSP